jgi:Spy/CpxP family protein refolding chaperone
MFRLTLGAVTLAAALALPAASRAQQASGSTPPAAAPAATKAHRHHFGRMLFHSVNVTKAERTQLRAIHQKYVPQIKAARQSGDRATVRTLRTQQLDEMRTVLTPDQQQTFDANRAALRARAKNRASTPSQPTPTSPAPTPQS